MKTIKNNATRSDPYAPLRGFEEEQASLAAGREEDYEIPPEHVTSEIKRIARRNHCLAIPSRGTAANGVAFLDFGEHQVMQSWETPYMQELAKVATSALDKGDVLELGYGMGISGGYVQVAIERWNERHPRQKRTHHISELNLDVAADCIRRNREAMETGRLILHIGDWRELLADMAGEVELLNPVSIHKTIARWKVQQPDNRRCHHVIAVDLDEAIAFMNRYKEAIADARLQLHVGNWGAMLLRLKAGGMTQTRTSLLSPKTFGGALLDTYALTSDERHFNQVPALTVVRALLADGGVLTYYGDAEKDFQPAHRQALVKAGFHPDNIDCTFFSFEKNIKGSAYENKYNKLSSMIIPKITAGPPKHQGQRLISSHHIDYIQPDGGKYHQLSLRGSLAYSEEWFSGIRAPITEEDLVSLADKVQRLFECFGREGTQAERIIEVGSGSNLGNTIAAAPFCNEYIGLERSPANVFLANSWVDGHKAELTAQWEGWRELAALCYAQASKNNGHALTWLIALKTKQPKTYETVRAWNRLPKSHSQKLALLSEARATEQKTGKKNPFLAVTSFVDLVKGKTKFIVADLIDEVDGNSEKMLANVQPYGGTADVVLANYVHESVNAVLLGVAHSLLNTAKLAKPAGLVINVFMEKTFQYGGFLMPLDECYASAPVFKALQAQISSILPSPLSYTSIDPAGADQVVRPGYMGVVALDGYRFATLPSTGRQLIDQAFRRHPSSSTDALVSLRASPDSADRKKAGQSDPPVRYGYCLASEQATFERDMRIEYERLYGVPAHISVETPSRPDTYI